MKYFGGVLVLVYVALHALGADRFPDDDRGTVPPSVRTSPGGIMMWHGGFLGGK
jgi:hypothetical protein